MKTANRTLCLIAAAGACVSHHALAQQNGGVVNISGATLLENWSASRASTNDFIDVDADGYAGFLGTTINGLPDQLADGGPSGFGSPGDPTAQQLVVQYRVTGSVNGFTELLRFGAPVWVTSDSFDPDGILGAAPASGLPNPGLATTAYHNRVVYITRPPNSGVRTGPYNAGNPGGAPNRADMTTYRATYATPDNPSSGGVQIDVSPLDVASFLAVRKDGGSPAWNLPASAPGYGHNPRNSTNKQGGTAGANYPAQLPSLLGRNLFNPSNPGSADANTIFDTDLLFAPIAPVVNPGTGIQRVTISELRHLFGAGRHRSGENYVVVTRDIGSGTRNAFQNCIGQDPSWGVGDNIGHLSTTGSTINLGPDFVPNNKGSNGAVESTLRNARLGVGYVGTERGVTGSGSGSWLTSEALEIADTMNDIYGGTQYVRPTTSNILHNSPNGWVIGGQAVIATIGDPRANGPSTGGTGWPGAFDPYIDLNDNNQHDPGEPFTDLNGNGVRDASNAEAGLANTNPPMANPFAARYINNITRSIAAFTEVPTDVANVGMPGEFAASQFLLLAALDNLHSNTDYLNLAPNPGKVLKIQQYIGNPANGNVHFNPRFAAYNMNIVGKVPTRNAGIVYSDAVPNGQNYVNQAGNAVIYGANLHARNRIAGDFNGDGTRSASDALDMIRAYRQRTGGPAWTAPDGIYAPGSGQEAVIEILGDFEGDGSFNLLDIRYWADGLVLTNGSLDRPTGFAAVDAASQALTGNLNFFGTILANPSAPYTAGATRADVANASSSTAPPAPISGCVARSQINPTTRGWAPIGADGNGDPFSSNDRVIDCVDISYVQVQYRSQFVTDGQANWLNLDEAVHFDLSADMNADLVVDAEDVRVIIEDVLATVIGDVNLDGQRDAADLAIATANLGMTNATYCCGDMDGDGLVTEADISLIAGAAPCDPDVNCDGSSDGFDVETMEQAVGGDMTNFCQSDPDFNRDGSVDGFDIEAVEQVVGGAPCP